MIIILPILQHFGHAVKNAVIMESPHVFPQILKHARLVMNTSSITSVNPAVVVMARPAPQARHVLITMTQSLTTWTFSTPASGIVLTFLILFLTFVCLAVMVGLLPRLNGSHVEIYGTVHTVNPVTIIFWDSV
jgi:hypothetical protein